MTSVRSTARINQRPSLVGETADALRNRVFAAQPGELIGSLQHLAQQLGVGIVTLQQAARVLEHEGLLEARRGPGGGYYGARPGAEALERAMAAWLRTHPASFEEALDITSLLFIELCAAAALCNDEALHAELAALCERIAPCNTTPERGAFEADFQALLFRMVERPLFELLTHVTLAFAQTQSEPLIGVRDDALAEWKAGRRRIVDAILLRDGELARFEAGRSNRRLVLAGLAGRRARR
ncbi:MAG: FadR family transcriptional regulator [Sphingomonadales bacterium]|nr:FadR family transcriptional regulator [Sphingomonadales bacterium]